MKIFDNVSHLDHGLTQAQKEFLSEHFAQRNAFFIETIELPPELGTVSCGIVGPSVGTAEVFELEVCYTVRGTRKYASRMLRAARTPVRVRTVTVIAGPAGKDDGLPEEYPCVLYTAFGGPQAPREPGDPGIENWAELEASRTFWAQHALIAE